MWKKGSGNRIRISSTLAAICAPDHPLLNRTMQGQYPPGSTIKPFIALGGLETGVITTGKVKHCSGAFQLPGQSHRYRDWRKGGHGSVDMRRAIVESCDVYFYDLAHHLGIDRLDDFLGKFHFGRKTGVDMAGELGGLLPSKEWKRRVRHQAWYPGETLIVGIGQGAFLATPLQLAAATAAIANGETGVMIDTGASGNTIGGATAAARNVISGNTQYGVIVSAQAGATTNNIIQGNYLGTNAAGTAAVSNGGFGVVIDYAASNTSILNNVISGNTNTSWSASRGGIYLYANGATIQGNIIGLDATGTVTLGNGGGASTAGIFEAGGSSNVLIGGTGASQGNTIAGNTGAGVAVLADPGNIQILTNSIYGNTGLGIDLGNNGVTTNDAGDADSGANNLQNFPALIGATTNGSTIVIAGSLNSTASGYYRIEFFSNSSADGTGYGEGRTYLGYANVNTNGSGNATFNTTLSVSVAAGQYVSATATKANASYTTFTDTSEFAQNVTAVAPNNAPSGTNKTQTILEDASHIFSTADFGFSDPSDSPANNLLAVKISTLPTAGSLTLSGAAVTAGQTITAAAIRRPKSVGCWPFRLARATGSV